MTQCCLSLAVFACVLWALFTLFRIFSTDDPSCRFSYLPHLVILAAISISVGQAIYVFSRGKDPA